MFADLHFGELSACKLADSLSCRRFHGNVGDLEENGGRAAFSQVPLTARSRLVGEPD